MTVGLITIMTLLTNIKINMKDEQLIELATELAFERVDEEFGRYLDNSDYIGDTEKAQSCFNMWYDYYYNFIYKYKIEENGTS